MKQTHTKPATIYTVIKKMGPKEYERM